MATKPKDNRKLGVSVAIRKADNSVHMFFTADGKPMPGPGLGMPPEGISGVVALLMGAAITASKGEKVQTRSLAGIPCVRPSEIGLGTEGQKTALVIHAGKARIGIELDKKQLTDLFQTLKSMNL